MKAEERRSQQRLLDMWQGMLDRLNRVGPVSDARVDLEAFGEVKDYILDRIDAHETILRNATPARPSSRRRVNGLHRRDNALDNHSLAGVDNG